MVSSLYPDFRNPDMDWETMPVRSFLRLEKEEVGQRWAETQLLSLTKKGVIARDIDSGVGKYPASFEGYQYVEPGDLVFCLFDVEETPRTIGLVKNRGMITSAYTRARLDLAKIESRYAEYLFLSLDDEKRFRPFYNGLRNTIQKETFRSTRLSIPLLDEQRRIADFLERETAKIDTLIAKQEQLITTLDERRGAVISRAVTRGLVEDRPLHDSGVEWLGEIPENWQAMPLRWCATLQTGSTPRNGEYTDSDECPWFRPDDLDETGAPSSATRFYPRAAVATLPLAPANSTLVGAIGTIGKVGYLTENAYFNQQITAVTPRFDSRFAFYVLKAAQGALEALSVGNTLQILNNYRLGSLITPIPPRPEQRAIAEYLDSEVGSINRIKRQAKRLSELLVERRQALISAAVTGKLEVDV